jgi:predicted CXXCH cytochrome family protein
MRALVEQARAAGLLGITLVMVPVPPIAADTETYAPGTGINGTVHDLSWSEDGVDCHYCHAPHNAYTLSPSNFGPGSGLGSGLQAGDAFDYLPLWNHELTANAPFYTMYQSGPGAPRQGPKASQSTLTSSDPGGISLLCLGCHDGSVAVNSYGNASQPLASRGSDGRFISPRYVIGQDNYLGNHHPIGFNYDVVRAQDREIRSADAARLTSTDSVRDHLYGDSNSMMECGTCHSVHNTGNGGESLLWRSNRNSELCLTCHDKGTYVPPGG